MTDTTHVVPGDTLTLTLQGKIVEPGKANTPAGTTLKIYRPARSPLFTSESLRVDLVLDADATVTYEIQPRWKNGVHIDGNGRYWMRRPDGWHEMSIAPNAVPNIIRGSQYTPPNVQRLREDKE